MANHQFGLCRSCATIDLPASSACNDSAENWADARAPSCFKVRKPSRTARSRRHGLSFPARGQVIFPDCAARAALKATLERSPTDGWITGSNDVGSSKTVSCSQDSCCRFTLEVTTDGRLPLLVHSNSSSNSSRRRSNNCSVLSIGAGVVMSTPAAVNVSSGNLEPPERKNFK